MEKKAVRLKNVICLNDTPQKGALLLPIRLTIFYLLFSLFVYIVCPFEWDAPKPVLFYSLLIFYMAAVWLGYHVGISRKSNRAFELSPAMTDKLIRTVSLLTAFSCILYVINIFRNYGFATFDFVGLWKQMWIGIQNPGLGYMMHAERVLSSMQGSDVVGGYTFTLISYIWSFIELPAVILSLLYFSKLKPCAKISTVLYIALTLVFYLSIGTNIRVFHVYLLIELPAIIAVLSQYYHKQLTRKNVCRFIISMVLGLLLMACYFTWMIVSRGGINRYEDPSYNVGGVSIDIGTPEPDVHPNPPADDPENNPANDPENNPVEPPEPSETTPAAPSLSIKVPPILMKFWLSFSSYLTQGYHGMSLALTEPWTPMFGFGNSMFVVNFVTEHVYDIDQYTYQVKVERDYGWDSDIQWASMYSWLANDVSFYGVILVMFLIGFLLALIYKDAITTNNPFAKAGIFYFILMLLFIPCNNQLAQNAYTLFSFVFVMFSWILSRCLPNILQKKAEKRNRRTQNCTGARKN